MGNNADQDWVLRAQRNMYKARLEEAERLLRKCTPYVRHYTDRLGDIWGADSDECKRGTILDAMLQAFLAKSEQDGGE